MSKIIPGIDLGTSNSVISIYEGNTAKVLVNSEGSRTTPSVVAFTDSGERLVGRAAKSQRVINPSRSISSIKRFMGRKHSEILEEEKLVSYKVVGKDEELVQVEVDGKKYYPPEISAMILKDLKRTAETYLGHEISDVTITTPAYFNSVQKQSTIEAAKIAGLNCLRIINEPTAACLAHNLQNKKNGKFFVIDIGGGTTDTSLVNCSDGVLEVVATNGDTHLAGDDFDNAIVNYVCDEFKKSSGVDLRKDPMALQRLIEACEKAKCDLSSTSQVSISLPYVTAVNNVPKHLNQTLTRAKFEDLCDPLFKRLIPPIRMCLKDAGVSANDIDDIVMVGGSTRIPKIQEICKEIFGGKELDFSLNPDECVSIGASIQGAILAGDQSLKDIVLLDITPLSLSVETMGGISSVLIEKNTTIPCRKTQIYSTAEDNQTAVDIHVLQGERKFAKDNRTLGKFQLSGIPLSSRGLPQIEITFDINADGILNVTAKDKGTGKEQKIEIKSSSGLSKEDIERMVKEASDNEQEDKEKAELIEAKNKADQFCYQGEKLIKDSGDKLKQESKDSFTKVIEEVKEELKKDLKIEEVKSLIEKIEKESQKIAVELYSASQPAQGSGSSVVDDLKDKMGGQPKNDDVIDAEFKEVK